MLAGKGDGFSKTPACLDVCRDSITEGCNRPQCKYAHPPPYVEVVDFKVQCCTDFTKGRCFRTTCRYFHPPPYVMATMAASDALSSFGGGSKKPFKRIQRGMINQLTHAIASCNAVLNAALAVTGGSVGGGLKTDKMEVCRDFLRGNCDREDCRYAHPPEHVPVDDSRRVSTCIDFLNHKCDRVQCRYFHPPPFLMKERCPSSICKDFLRGRCDRNPCRFLHSATMSGVDEKTRDMMTCRDYLNGKCSRAVCCFYHPPQNSSAVEPAAMQDATKEAMPAAANAAAAGNAGGGARHGAINEICRDFLLNRCNRAVCCYLHPADKSLIVQKQSEMTCKDFLRGVCHRSECRFYHPPMANKSREGMQEYAAYRPSMQPNYDRPSMQRDYAMLSMQPDYERPVLQPDYDRPSMQPAYEMIASRQREFPENALSAAYASYGQSDYLLSAANVANRKRGYAEVAVNGDSASYGQVYLTDYSHSAQPIKWETSYAPAKRQMTDYY